MLSRLRQLYRRYASQHLDIRIPGFPLFDGTGAVIGNLDILRIAGQRLVVEGWAEADSVSLVTREQLAETRPRMPRQDVAAVRGAGTHAGTGFVLDTPFELTATVLCVTTVSGRCVFLLPLPDAAELRRRRRRLALPFLTGMLLAVPAILRWRLTGDPAARAAVKRRLGFTDGTEGAGELPARLFRAAGPRPADGAAGAGTPVTLILPIYNAFDLLPEVLDRVLRHTDLSWHLVAVEDCSSDDRVRAFLRDWVAAREAETPGRITLIENPRNLGFIRSVNAAFEIALERGDHVVLLNSDALVPAGWASRLIDPILARNGVASVTPMSNDAEIFSVPVICRASQLTPGLADAVDKVAGRLDPEFCQAAAPTGVGFCMAINIDYLRRVPRFDTGFGRGYGEEVDWCQRVRALGGRHLGLAGLFVEHRGGASFGSAEKRRLVARNNAVISSRYPSYDEEVQAFIRDDSLAGPRLALAIALEAERQAGPVPIYLAHSLGGGAQKYLERRIAREIEAGGSAVVVRVGGRRRWCLELHEATGQVRAQTDEAGLIEALLDPLGARRIVYSCGAGDPDPVALPDWLLGLRRGPSDRIEVLFHDFFPLSPSYTLLNGDGEFRGVPAPDDADPVHQASRPDGSRVRLAEWRVAWGRLIEAADELVVFSKDSAAHVRSAYPQVADRLTVRPHRMLVDVPPVAAVPRDPRPVIGILGNIGYQKGAKVVADLARVLDGCGAAKLVLVGNIDPNYVLPASVAVHGDYRIEDIPDLVARYRVAAWLIPSIWPETFSFATHEALATGLPVICFDLGAQGEAVRAAPRGQVIALQPGQDPAEAVLGQLARFSG